MVNPNFSSFSAEKLAGVPHPPILYEGGYGRIGRKPTIEKYGGFVSVLRMAGVGPYFSNVSAEK